MLFFGRNQGNACVRDGQQVPSTDASPSGRRRSASPRPAVRAPSEATGSRIDILIGMRRFACATLLVAAVGCSKPAPPPPPAGPAEDQITAESLTNHLKVLASDEYEGRA